ncbi:MAG: YidC/Oxa1 family membrane protein insertase [Clostridia bacterium]|nr:YidC/Oxa1 family membrane protein insertase [Clostridia bacterium]
MSVLSILETFFIGPLKLIFEVIFNIANDIIVNPGIAIVFLSLAMNVLVLPLYKRADAMQQKARDTEAALKDGIKHIKQTFSGNERMMMLQVYYRQNNYSPVNALRGSISLFLEIPFFMAAYQFLSHLEILKGVPFGPIADLSAPDGLIVIGTLTINVLPVIMTVINFVSCAIYLRGFPLKTKLQLYGIAIFFLVFLYSSPSGLVFYWTLNNIFSLFKNIFYKLKNPKLVLSIMTFVLGIAAIVLYAGAPAFGVPYLRRKIVLAIGILLLVPLAVYIVKSKLSVSKREIKSKPSRSMFFASAIFLTLFTGVLIPSNFIADAPLEYIDVTYFFNPLWNVVSSFLLAGGTFVLWFGVFYWIASPKGKVVIEWMMWTLCGVSAVDYMFFGTKLGILTESLKYENGLALTRNEKIINLAVLTALAAVFVFVFIKWKKAAKAIAAVAAAAVAVMSGINVVTAQNSVSQIKLEEYESTPHFNLSKEGNNVVVLFLDRAMGEYLPYIFNENPELAKKFDGFTYYNNVLSFGGYTNFGSPPLLGGYEYTPVEMNRRDEELLVDKHNEALKVMPVLFSENGYDVTVCDPTYANYKWIPDLSIYDDYPEINRFITKGFFGSPKIKQQTIDSRLRNFFCLSIMKSAPLAIQHVLYDGGDYNSMPLSEQIVSSQTGEDAHVAYGIESEFMDAYNALCNLKNMTNIEDEGDTFLLFYNDTPHRLALLKEPEYEPAEFVDNTEYDEAHADRFTVNGVTLATETRRQMMLYHTNMASLLTVGDWLDYLRDEGVYDNTKIIIVADHGYYLRQIESMCFDDLKMPSGAAIDVENYFPLLMVKDFGAKGFNTSSEFMTNADVPTIAFKDTVDDPVNPFTGKPINSDEKTAHDQFIVTDNVGWSIDVNHGTTYLPTSWASITNNIWDRDDWVFYNEQVVLTEYKMPD